MPQKKKTRKKNRLFHWIKGISYSFVALTFALLQMLSYLSAVVNPAKVWFFSIFGLLFLPIFIINIILAVWAAAHRSPLALIPLIAILPSVFFVGRFFRGNQDEIASFNRDDGIRIITCNIDRFAYDRKIEDRNERIDSVLTFLQKHEPDVICLQEFYCSDPSDIKHLIKKHLPGYEIEYYLFKARKGFCGNVTLSRFKASDKGKILFEDSRNLALWTEYDVRSQRFRVYNCHFESYAISLSNIWLTLTGNSEARQETGTKYRKSLTRRPKQVDAVLTHFDNSPCAGVVCGDFNDNPMSYTYHRVRRVDKDSFIEAGDGFGATFTAFWPLLRIDYVFVPENWTVVSHKTVKTGFSDHYPIITDCILSD